ncbi:MAG TPA: hypothetical protein VHE12_06400 [bacterium]|nr:hypothetical protein [bacterium]
MKFTTSLKTLCSVFALLLTLSLASWVRAHEHHPPHHGTLVELGEEFAHVELLLDPATGRLDAFSLDGEAENPVRISQPSLQIKVKQKGGSWVLKLKPIANALTGETVGDTSQYRATSKKLKGMTRFEGTILRIKTKGTEFKDVWFLYPEGNEGVQKPGKEG